MACRGKTSSVLHNFLGTYTSRYSDYDGYWLFGMVVDHLDSLDIDLLHPEGNSVGATPVAFATWLAVERFAEQIERAGLSISHLREARLSITKSPVVTHGPVNGHVCAGHYVRFAAKAVSQLGTTYERATSVFVAPHDPRVESRSTRGPSSVPQCRDKPVNIPSDNDVVPKRSRSFRLDLSPRSWRNGLLLILLIVGCDSIGMLVGILGPAVQAAREAGRRTQCVKNLEKIGLAMQSYHQEYSCFPPSFIPDENGKPKHSWRVLLLPFLGEQGLYAQYCFDEPWNGPKNMVLDRKMPGVYHCPSDSTPSLSQTSYAMIVGPHTISDGPTARRMSDIKDGPANTIMVAEAAKTGINWMEPRDLDAPKMDFCTRAVEKDLQRNTCEIFRSHDAVANVLFCDGSVRTLANESVNPKELEAMMTIDGSETVRAGR